MSEMEKFTPLAKILHCHRQWRHGQIPPLQWWMFSILARFEAFLILFFFLLGGRSEYWDAIAIMEYKDRASFCRMVSLKSLCFPISLVIFYFSFVSSLAGSQQWVELGVEIQDRWFGRHSHLSCVVNSKIDLTVLSKEAITHPFASSLAVPKTT